MLDLSDMDRDLIIQALARSYRQTGELIMRLQQEAPEAQRQEKEAPKPELQEVK